ncbi:MAG: pyruvate, water dikinase regulatory protein [Geminicoccaceae bacterium]
MRLHLHLVSDSTGETVTTVARAALAQFDEVVPVEHVWFFVRTRTQLERALSFIDALPGVVVFTLVQPQLRDLLQNHCRQRGIPCVPILDGLIGTLSEIVGSKAQGRAGGQHALDAEYFTRIEAMNFVMHHDDGQSPNGIKGADVVVVGVSRTSKTPTCIYLANRGVKAANLPVVPDRPSPVDLDSLQHQLVVGLTINPEQLAQIRRNRQRMLGIQTGGESVTYGGDYADLERVRDEIRYARQLCARYHWPVIDVTRRSVEETAAAIYQMLQERRQPELREPPAG